MGATHQRLDPFKGGILRRGRRAAVFFFELLRQKTAQGFAGFVVCGGNVGGAGDVLDFVFAADTDRAVLRAEPASPIACFELFELVSLRTGVEQDEIRDRTVQLAPLLPERRAGSRAEEPGAGGGRAAP